MPERYRPMIDGKATIALAPQKLFEAMRPSIAPNFHEDPELKVYRVCFDEFFAHLERIHRHAEQRRIQLQDLCKSLDYWLWRIVTPQYCPHDKERLHMFLDFLEAAEYHRVVKLLIDAKATIKRQTDDFREHVVSVNHVRRETHQPPIAAVPPWREIEARLHAVAVL